MIIVAACWWKEKQSEVHWEFTEHIFLYIHEELMRKRNQTNSQSQVCDFLYLLIRIQSQVGFEPTPAPTEYELWCALLAFILTKLSVLLKNSLLWILILIAMQLFFYFKSLLKNKHICLSGFFLELHPSFREQNPRIAFLLTKRSTLVREIWILQHIPRSTFRYGCEEPWWRSPSSWGGSCFSLNRRVLKASNLGFPVKNVLPTHSP